jgi:hypothetical protein
MLALPQNEFFYGRRMRRAPAFRKPPTNCTGALHGAIAMLSSVSLGHFEEAELEI